MDLQHDDFRRSDSPLIDHVWHSASEAAGSFISIADMHFSLVVTVVEGRTWVTFKGPETVAYVASWRFLVRWGSGWLSIRERSLRFVRVLSFWWGSGLFLPESFRRTLPLDSPRAPLKAIPPTHLWEH